MNIHSVDGIRGQRIKAGGLGYKYSDQNCRMPVRLCCSFRPELSKELPESHFNFHSKVLKAILISISNFAFDTSKLHRFFYQFDQSCNFIFYLLVDRQLYQPLMGDQDPKNWAFFQKDSTQLDSNSNTETQIRFALNNAHQCKFFLHWQDHSAPTSATVESHCCKV